jgi:hypothetical protein
MQFLNRVLTAGLFVSALACWGGKLSDFERVS